MADHNDHNDYIDQTLQEYAERAALAPQDQPVLNTILDSQSGGVVRLLDFPEAPMEPALQYLRTKGRTQYVPLSPASLDALVAWWQARKGGAA